MTTIIHICKKMRDDDPLNCNRTMALKDFVSWLADFASDRGARQERLIRTVERAFEVKRKSKKIVVKGPLVLKVLRKVEA